MRTVVVDVRAVFHLPDGDDTPIGTVRDRFLEAHLAVVGQPMTTINGQEYTLHKIERFEVRERTA